MLQFLNSILLPALAVSVIPVIIHFFNKRKARTIPFGSIRFLKMLESQRIKYLRLYQILLVVIRTLFLISLVLVFTRPTLKSLSLMGQASATTAVIVLDDSYSMQSIGTSLSYHQKAKAYIKKILTTFNNNDKVFLLQPSLVTDSALVMNLSNQQAINSLTPSYSSPDFNKLFERVAHIFDEHVNYNQELYLISDFRFNQSLFPDSLQKLFVENRMHIFKLNPGHEVLFNNIGIDTVTLQNQILEQDKPFFIRMTLHNYNHYKEQDTRIHVFEEQERLAMKNVLLAGGATLDVELPIVPRHAGTRKLHVELDSDDLLVDNNYYINLNIASTLNVLFIGNTIPLQLDKALLTLNEETKLSINKISFSGMSQKELTKYNLVILYNPSTVNSDLLNRLLTFAGVDRSILIIPGGESTPAQLNELVNHLCRINPILPLKSASADAEYFPLQEISSKHPLFQSTRSNDKIYQNLPHIYKFFPIQPSGEMLIGFKNKYPLLTSFPIKNTRSRLYLFSSAFDPAWSNLPTHGLFIPLLHRLMYFIGQPIGISSTSIVGQHQELYIPGASLKDNFSLEIPGGERRPVNPISSDKGIFLVLRNIDTPGHYQVFKNNSLEHIFSVNVSSAELREPYVDFNSIPGKLYHPEDSEAFTKQIIQSRAGFELWYIFAAIALLLLLLEIVIIKNIEGKFERKPA